MTGADILVIGGGMAGVSVAARMAAEARVALLEAEANLGYHATGRSAAIFIRNYGNATLRALNAHSVPFFEAPDEIDEAPLLTPRGELLLAGEDEMPALESYAQGAEGLERLTASQAQDLVPILRPDRIAAAIYESDAQDIDVDRMLQGFARLLRARGGQIRTGARITAMSRDKGLWTVETDQGRFAAPIVVNAAGAWASPVARMAGALPIPVTPCRRSAALLPAPEAMDGGRWPLFGSVSETWYAKPDAGRLMVSPADEDPVEPQDAWADDMVLAEGLHRYEQAVTVPVTRVERSWAGLRSFAPDRTPVVGPDPLAEGFFWLAGQGGYGIQTAPALSRIAAEICLGRTDDGLAPLAAALSPARFA
ncbi:NAD(P)/FAD-dependent oxidoreductase [Mameliella sediminis]|uniref:NAD(P)/FAD-dependent oxidoreductase n=1 Tax=Mameliella sediminis TaxID=2836866 RepID=UPI001C48492C|nr:FAD-dependent oxidoreductase [Mameliella sediminis]MBV7393790.1 FAD-binding oxidoreductase [Mameliella sediminis]